MHHALKDERAEVDGVTMQRWSLTAALAAGLLIALPPQLHAQDEDAEAPTVVEAEAPTEVDAEGAAEYRDVQELNALENGSFAPTVLGVQGPFDLDLLAPTGGTLGAMRFDGAGPADVPISRKAKTGAELLTIPAVRKRFENTTMFGLTVHDEPSVRAYLDFFDGRGKPILAKWLARMGRYQPLIEKVLAEEGLPQDLVYVAMIESGFSPFATSPAAAAGVWQFIPTTGSDMGLRIDRWVDERRDPIKATHAAAKYLKLLHDRFESWPLALAAYNGGPGLVRNEVYKHNSNNYWRIQRLRGMYDETRRYVPKIIAAGLVAKNADIFGLAHVEAVRPEDFTTVEVPASTRLSVVAQACGVDFDTIRWLNPALVRKQTPPGEDGYPVRIPADRLDRFVAKFDGFVRDEAAQHVRHTVAFGESLSDVAAKYQVAPRVLRVANGLERRERVSYGDEILVPKSAMGKYKPRESGTRTVVVANAKLSLEGKERHFYEIEKGDTLDAVGRALGLNPADLVIWNDLDPVAKLQPGMVLQVFLPQEANLESVALLDTDSVKPVEPGSVEHKRIVRKKSTKKRLYYRVRPGDSLWKIAQKYKVTVDDIKKWNRSVRRSNTLQPGQKLVVYPGRS